MSSQALVPGVSRMGGVISRQVGMRFLTGLSLQKRIGLLFLGGMAVGLGLFSILGIQSLNDSTKRTLEERLITARIVASQIDETLTYVLVQLQNTAGSMGESPTESQFELGANSLHDILAQSGIFSSSILLLDGDGKVLQYPPGNFPVAVGDMLENPEVKKVLESGAPRISSLISTSQIEAPVVLAIAPIVGSQGESRSVLIASLDIKQSRIGTFSQPIVIGATGYTEIVDQNGIVLARSEPGRPLEPLERSDHPGRFAMLIQEGKASVRTCHRCHGSEESPQRRKDVLAFAPLSKASWGVAIRQAEEEALAPTIQLKRRLLLGGAMMLVSAFLVVGLAAQGVIRPIRMLTSASKKVAAGDFKAVIPLKRRDEIGELATAFRTMTRQLDKSRDELVSRNRELSALNSIAATVSQSLNLEDVLGNALQKVLELTKAEYGCIFLRGSDGKTLEMKSDIGSADLFRCQESGSATANCACYQVLGLGQAMMVNEASQCPMLREEKTREEDTGCFISVPLKSKVRALGIMNISCSRERCFTEEDFRLLDSIGRQMGLAIENSILYEEAKQKEELRGQLLNKIIGAQEEERKRLARELHDEYGQTLTGLILSIESLEDMIPPEQLGLKEKLTNTRSLAVRTLEDMRRLILGLRPSVLDDLGLVAAIRAYAQDRLQASEVSVHLETSGIQRRLSPSVETALFRIFQEAVHNIARHAEARNAKIWLEVKDNKVVITVEDDGKGFDVDAIFKSSKVQSLGLLGIRERVELLGGTFNIKSEVGRGTCLTVEIPLDTSALPERLEQQTME